nr:MAG TPA_asm: hypothetical protein [Caudoviricetes sp.]
MGTNFYFFTQNRAVADLMGSKREVTDIPELGWEMHIAKTSCGWKPVFEEHEQIRSVRDLDRFYHDNRHYLTIFDEYGTEYSWPEFEERVIKHGTPKVFDPEIGMYTGNWRCESDNDCELYKHWDGEYADADGYRFSTREFC